MKRTSALTRDADKVHADLKTAAAVPLRPREERKAVMRQPGDSTALKCSMMKARLAGSTGC